MRFALPAAMLCLWLWAGLLPYFAEANQCFGEDSLFKKCNCICYDEDNALCGEGGRHIQCMDAQCEDELERFTEFPSLDLDFDPNITCL